MQRPTNDRSNFQFTDESDRNKEGIRRFTRHELEILHKAFREQPKPHPNRYRELACQLDCSSQKVRSYFSKRRAHVREAEALAAEALAALADASTAAPAANTAAVAQPAKNAMPVVRFQAGGFPARPANPATNQAVNAQRFFSLSDAKPYRNPTMAELRDKRGLRKPRPVSPPTNQAANSQKLFSLSDARPYRNPMMAQLRDKRDLRKPGPY